MFFNRITSLVLCIALSTISFCQNKEVKLKFGDIKPADFKPDYLALDSSADAVYLDDIGSSHHVGNTNGWFSVVYTVHERILLIHKKSFDDLATVKIYLAADGSDKEKLDNLQAATYNFEDGKVVQKKVDKNSFFHDKDGDDQVIKFTFPNLKEGSIIEYTYTRNSPFFQYIPTWTFQGQYPELWSQFTIEEPQFFDFVTLKQGYLQPAIDEATTSADNFHVLQQNGTESSNAVDIRSTTIKHTWAYKNVPPLKEENYITTLSNYIQKLEFQLAAIKLPDEQPQTFLTSWYEAADQMMKHDNFGADLQKENGWLKEDVKDAIKNETDALAKAKSIYAFVRDNYTCTDDEAVFLSQSLKKTQQTKKGNVADINMLLVAMLHIAGFDANPVLVSTRDNGKPYDMYPIISKFNYVVAQCSIDDKSYVLDASNPLLGFARLSQNCYNGDARMIADQPVVVNLSPDSLRESEVISLFMSNDADGKMTGTYKHVMDEMQSQEMRSKMKKTTAEDYFKDVKKSFAFDVDINNTSIDSLEQFEMPVSVQYDMSFKPEDDIIYFTPILADGAYKENPFSAAQRSYPVEMPYCFNETYILNMEVPAGYKVDELPKSVRVNLNDTEGKFEYLVQQNDNTIQLRCTTKINKATFEPEDYETLRNFFAMVVEKESEQIVFKKM